MSEAPPAPSAPLSGTMLGRYRLERLLGEGGMGVVYAARHVDLGRPAAVKILNERYAGSEPVRARFLREGQAASRIRHPNIVDMYDVGEDGGRVYLVMELLEGEDLRGLLTRGGALSPQKTADLLVPVVAALAVAHDAGIVHRDLKPDNVFLSTERNALAPKVLDFGISKVIDDEKEASLTGTGAFLGTPYYMSPEQAQAAKSVDSKSDQYSLGVILYECVTGRRPIEEQSVYALIHRIVRGDFAPPRQVEPSVPAAFEQLILTAMAVSPAHRFADMRALGRALLPFAGDRTRANFADDLAGAEAVAPVASSPQPDQVQPLGTTMSESVHSRDTVRRQQPPRGGGFRMAGVFALIIAAGGLLAVVKRAPNEGVPPASNAPTTPSANSVLQPAATGPARSSPQVAATASSPSPSGDLAHKVLDSDPPGASVFVGDRQLGVTPLTVDVPPGEPLAVELRLAGFEIERRPVTTADPQRVVFKLVAKAVQTKPPAQKHVSRPELAPR